MFGNGAGTGTGNIRVSHKMTLRDRHQVEVAFLGVVHGIRSILTVKSLNGIISRLIQLSSPLDFASSVVCKDTTHFTSTRRSEVQVWIQIRLLGCLRARGRNLFRSGPAHCLLLPCNLRDSCSMLRDRARMRAGGGLHLF